MGVRGPACFGEVSRQGRAYPEIVLVAVGVERLDQGVITGAPKRELVEGLRNVLVVWIDLECPGKRGFGLDYRGLICR